MSPKFVVHIAAKAALLLPLMAAGATEAVNVPQARSSAIEVELTELSPTATPATLMASNDFGGSDFGNNSRNNSDSNNQSDSGNQRRNGNNSDFG
ncbi:hypothetical protein [Synechococcus elongatus]|uniref:hypothetical protein n=1 Tax=Synechococcus elongatus TaxID=32046 RepID=UPI000F7E1626|nr:hypothetical protein [Synechococcus elongatus]